jgi:hypothetical protein
MARVAATAHCTAIMNHNQRLFCRKKIKYRQYYRYQDHQDMIQAAAIVRKDAKTAQ